MSTTWPAEVYVFDGTDWVSISPHGMTSLPPATETTIGGVIVGSGVNVDPDGTISVTQFSGDYNDLTNKPDIPTQVQSDWLAVGGAAYILNKPNFLSQFTNDLKVSDFPNDALYVDVAAAAAAAPIQSISAGPNVAISDDGNGNIVIAATGGGGGTPGGGITSVSGTAPIKVVDGLNAPVISLVIGAGLKVNSGALEADFSGLADDFVNVSGDTMTGSLAGIAGNATTQSFSVGKSGTGIHGSATYDRLFIATKGERRVLVNESGEISLGDWGPNAASMGSGVRIAPERTGTGTVRGVAIATQFDDAASDAQNVFIGGSVAAGTAQYTAMRFPQPSGATPEKMAGIFFDVLSGSTESSCIESNANAGTGAWFLNSTGTLPSYHAGQFQTGAGTAAEPSVSFIGDPTGTFSPGTGNWAVSTNGTERLRVRDDGNLGLGVAGAANILIDGETDQAFLARLQSTNDYQTGLYEGRCGYRIGNETNGPWYCEMYLDPTAKTYGFGGSSSGGSLPIIGGDAEADIVVVPKNSVTFNNQIRTPTGTAAAPSVSFIGDPTGIFSPAAGTWAVSTLGEERLRVATNGTILVGTTTNGLQGGSLARGLQLHSSTTTAEIKLTNSDTGAGAAAGLAFSYGGKNFTFSNREDGYVSFRTKNIERMRLTGSGALAVGGESDEGDAGLIFLADLDTGIKNVGDDSISFVCGGSTSVIVNRGGQLQTGLGTAAEPSVSYIGDASTGTFSPAAGTWAVSTNSVERLRVTSDGSVGIGIDPSSFNPAFDDLVVGDGTGDHGITVFGDTTGTIAFADTSGGSGSYSGYVQYLHSSDKLIFGTVSTAKLWLDSSGNLGVGISTPATKLDVVGQVAADSSSAAAVAYGFRGDTSTGTFSPAAGNWAVSTGGVERLRVDATGKVCCGGNFPVGRLTVLHDFAVDSSPTQVFYTTNAEAGDYIHTNFQRGSRNVGQAGFAVDIATTGSEQTSFVAKVGNGSGGVTDAIAAGYQSCVISTAGTERLRVKSTGGVRYVPLAAAPTTPEEGEVYFDSTTKKLRVYDGTAWADLH